ncbi:Hypothetical protein A7982_04893 [Minicystis rosea]|nr:Hypothetical protein A7982_04893 [Minicystis rosea]
MLLVLAMSPTFPRPTLPSQTARILVALTAFAALAPLGCMSAAIDDRANARVAEVRADTEAAVVNTSCMDGRALGTNCGLIMRRLATDDFRKLFRENFCKDITAEACQTRYERMINARLEQRYYAANQEAVARTCDANPGRCEDPIAYEMLMLDSHNGRVLQEGARAELKVEHARRRAHAADVNATLAVTAAALGDVAYATHNGPKCRTYPSLLGGTNTVCSDGRR